MFGLRKGDGSLDEFPNWVISSWLKCPKPYKTGLFICVHDEEVRTRPLTRTITKRTELNLTFGQSEALSSCHDLLRYQDLDLISPACCEQGCVASLAAAPCLTAPVKHRLYYNVRKFYKHPFCVRALDVINLIFNRLLSCSASAKLLIQEDPLCLS